jgi:hypothetical protein
VFESSVRENSDHGDPVGFLEIWQNLEKIGQNIIDALEEQLNFKNPNFSRIYRIISHIF